ncbi:MAG: transposase [bacterium]
MSNCGARDTEFFIDAEDRRYFRELLERYAPEYSISIYAYALMSSHFHLAVESHSGRLPEAMKAIESEYARRFNWRHGYEGHLVEKRYFSELVEDGKYFMNLIVYILTNPQRAGLIPSDVFNHPWTSLANKYFGDPVVDWPGLFKRLEVNPDNFYALLQKNLNALEFIEKNRCEARRIKIVGSEGFLEKVLEKEHQPFRDSTARTGPIEPEEILNDICETWGFANVQELKSTKRDQKNSILRYLAFYLLKTRSHMSVTKTGEEFGVTAMAVSKGIKKFRSLPKDKKIMNFLKKWNVQEV